MIFVVARRPATPDEEKVRSTIQPVINDKAPAEIDGETSIAVVESDQSPELTGLTDRQVGGDERPSEKFPPWWKGLYQGPFDGNEDVSRRQSTNGTAAARESAGDFGSGTAQYQVSLTPELREGIVLGGDHFLSVDKVVQQGSGLVMTSNVNDPEWIGVAQRLGTKNSRDAYQATLYTQFLEG